MFATVTRQNTAIAVITKAAHGLVLPGTDKLMGVYVDATGAILPADATSFSKQKAFLVTEIIDVNTIRVQTTGFWTSTAHGYTIGEYYFITDAGDGGVSVTAGTVNDICFLVVDANTLMLIDNRAL